jgi:hypothetical protein
MISQLTPTELLLLQRHLKLGKSHLKKYLSPKEISVLFSISNLDQETERQIEADTPEMVGGISLILNSVFTAILGAWTGTSGFLELSLDRPLYFYLVVLACLIVGGFVGYHNFQFMRKNAQEALEQEESKAIELNLLKIINQRRETEIAEKWNELKAILTKLGIQGIGLLDQPLEELNDHEVCLKWLDQAYRSVEQLEKGPSLARVFVAEIDDAKSSLSKELAVDQKQRKGIYGTMIGKLTAAPLSSTYRQRPWLIANFRSIVVSFIPALLGGFSSLCVYLSGAPRLAEEMEKNELYHFLSIPEVKYIELAIAIGITFFFAYSSAHSNWKSFQRDEKLNEIQSRVTKEETRLGLADDRLLKIKQISNVMKPIYRLYQALNKLVSP